MSVLKERLPTALAIQGDPPGLHSTNGEAIGDSTRCITNILMRTTSEQQHCVVGMIATHTELSHSLRLKTRAATLVAEHCGATNRRAVIQTAYEPLPYQDQMSVREDASSRWLFVQLGNVVDM